MRVLRRGLEKRDEKLNSLSQQSFQQLKYWRLKLSAGTAGLLMLLETAR